MDEVDVHTSPSNPEVDEAPKAAKEDTPWDCHSCLHEPPWHHPTRAKWQSVLAVPGRRSRRKAVMTRP